MRGKRILLNHWAVGTRIVMKVPESQILQALSIIAQLFDVSTDNNSTVNNNYCNHLICGK